MRTDWKIAFAIYTAVFTVERIGRNPRGESIFRRPTVDNDHSRKELVALAELGALNWVGYEKHRRDALWQSELAMRRVPVLLRPTLSDENGSPLQMMGDAERLSADFRNSGLTIGKHPMTTFREQLRRSGVYAASDLASAKDGSRLSVAGAVICRQQPGTAKGFVFLSLEDETGVANIIIRPNLFRALRPTVIKEPYLVVKGTLQNQFGVVSVKAMALEPLRDYGTRLPSHDFH